MEIDISKLKSDIAIIAHDTFGEYGHEVGEEAKKFVESSKHKLVEWINLFINGGLTRGEFLWLLNSQIDLIKLKTLEEAGIAAIKIDLFKIKVINVVIDVASKLIL